MKQTVVRVQLSEFSYEKLKIFFLLLTVHCSLITSLRSEPGLTAAQFLARDIGTRAITLGSAFTAVRGDLESIGYNPGALGTLKSATVVTTYAKGFADDNFGFLGFGMPLFKHFTIAGGIATYNAGKIDLNLSSGLRERRTAEEDYVQIVSIAFRPHAALSVGASLKPYQLALAEEYKVSQMAYDAGANIRIPVPKSFGELALGAARLNMGSDVAFLSQKDPIATKQAFGVAWLKEFAIPEGFLGSGDRYRLMLTIDQSTTKKEDPQMGYGLELTKLPLVTLIDWGALRLGFKNQKGFASPSFGFGWGIEGWVINYALVEIPKKAGWHHQVSVGHSFGEPRDE